jgi:hypothetical protein
MNLGFETGQAAPSPYAVAFGHLGATYGYDSIIVHGVELGLSLAVATNAETPNQVSAVQCGAVRCSAVQCGAVRCSAVQCGTVRCSAVQCGAVRCSAAVQCGAVRCSAVGTAVGCCGLQQRGAVAH